MSLLQCGNYIAQRNSGIAIKTTFKKLSDNVDKANTDRIKIGVVKYIDFEKGWMDEGNLYYSFFHKRKSFEHEKELKSFNSITD